MKKIKAQQVLLTILNGLNRNTKWKEDAIVFVKREKDFINYLEIDTLLKFVDLPELKEALPQYRWDTIKYNFTRKEKWDKSNVSETVKLPEEIVTEDQAQESLTKVVSDVVESKWKTPKEWFEALPDSCEWKQKALKNTNNNDPRNSLSQVLCAAFWWDRTPEKDAYWRKIQSEVLEDEQKQLEAVQGYDVVSNFVWTPEKDDDTYESLVENNFSKLSSEAIQKAFDKHGVKQAVKDSAGKISFKEIDPEFICLMARRMNSNKIQFGGKYEEFNYQKDINVLDLIDATERHLVDLKLLLQGRSPILNPSESELQHIASVSCNMMMIFYSINAKAQTIGQE